MKHKNRQLQMRPRISIGTAPNLAEFGVGRVAYLKEIRIGGLTAFAIVAADGERLALASCHRVAIAKAMQANLELVETH